jgi:cytochrome c peroxidase
MKYRNLLVFSFLFFLTLTLHMQCSDKKNSEKQDSAPPPRDLERVGALPASFTAPADNPSTPEAVELGRALFYDPILSGKKDVACVTCHHPDYGYAESQELSIGVNGVGLGELREFDSPNDIPFARRNAHTVLNTAFNGIDPDNSYHPEKAPMFWDLRTKSLELQALEPIKNFEEMRGHAYPAELAVDSVVNRLRRIPEYQRLFSQVFGGPDAVTPLNLGKALAAFERTLVANNSRFDQYMRGDNSALSISEKEGFDTFLKAGCARCHNGPMFSDFKLHVLGVADNQKLEQPDTGAGNTHAFRTPTLRNLRYTDPYMHNGTLKTLQNVLEFYEDLGGKKSHNPAIRSSQIDSLALATKVAFKDIQRIVEFLNTLNDDNFDRKVPQRVPSGLKVGGNI